MFTLKVLPQWLQEQQNLKGSISTSKLLSYRSVSSNNQLIDTTNHIQHNLPCNFFFFCLLCLSSWWISPLIFIFYFFLYFTKEYIQLLGIFKGMFILQTTPWLNQLDLDFFFLPNPLAQLDHVLKFLTFSLSLLLEFYLSQRRLRT